MLIRLIGPVRVAAEGGDVLVGATKQACVLAVLAARPGEPVSQPELINRVWGEELPDSVVNVLYSYVARLRRVLPPHATIRRAGAHGYVLDVAPDNIDVHVVRAEAAALHDTEPGVDVIDRWRRACDLADGVALAGIGGRWAEEYRTAFAQERLNLLTGRYEAELALGRHAAILDELAALAEREPSCEPLTALLMRTYYHCGRPADALSRYEALRIRLRDGLGADPSPSLRDLHIRILDQDPGLDPVAAKETGPALLPADVVTFTGRAVEMASLTDHAETHTSPLIAIVGPGGTGKTALAVHWGHSRRTSFPGGQLYVNLRGFDRGEPVAPLDALGRLLTALGVAGGDIPANVDAAAALYRARIADRRVLVVLDNARDADQVRPLLPGTGCTALVTSRNRLTGLVAVNDAKPLAVPLLAPGEALELLRRVLGPRRVNAEEDAAELLSRLCGHLPLALRIAAANLAVRPNASIADYTKELATTDRLEALAVDGDTEAAVAGNLDLSYQVLGADVRGLFQRIGALPGEDTSAELLTAVSGLSKQDTAVAIRHLVSGHLLEEDRPRRYRMHDLVRLYAAAQSERELTVEQRRSLIDGFIEWHFERTYEFGDDEETNVLRACDELREHPRLWRLAVSLRNTQNEGRSLKRIRELAQAAQRSAKLAGDRVGEFRMVSLLANNARKCGDMAAALRLGRQAAELAAHLGPTELVVAKGNLGIYLSEHGDNVSAEKLLTEAMELAAESGNVRSQLVFVNAVVQISLMVGACGKAAAFLASTEAAAAELGAVHRAKHRLYEGIILTDRGRFDEAIDVCEQALAVARRESDVYLECQCLSQMAVAHRRAGCPQAARSLHLRELALGEDRGLQGVRFEALTGLAHVEAILGEYDSAQAYLEEAGHTPQAVSPMGRVELAHIQSIIHSGRGWFEEAFAAAMVALEVYGGMPWIVRQVEALLTLAVAQDGLGDVGEAARSRAEAERLTVRMRES